ncbi:patatin-like phospholipase family protein [Phenylobacterium sp. J426]|uniref:patatin-like phospholipase family protein n=1 Tax=Phenylobacterium sp. J426 TaxID=2898439 RepID=UPI002151B33F|nr:patatin-like phospholipase family protein [Phenylobacterium sp. J426]MCR5876083.1 patatin-like phospholipase family protein [Phenylobacterium sp. J426]
MGLSRAGTRPTFDLVTGVSTGALIAPFALLGPAWDEKLQDAYTGGYAAELLGLGSVRPGMSLYPAARLEALVERYVDPELIQAVAEAHRAGRRLFVATANLDAQTTSIWDMGGIAAHGGPDALRLFADILIASASVPGVFPPKLLRVEADGIGYDELHVDGGAISPLFVVPEPLILHRAREHAAGGVEVYVLVNTNLEPSPRPTPLGAVPVLVRSFELMLRSSYRSAVRSVAAFCQLNGFALHSASIPHEGDGANMLRFDREAMTRLFKHGAEIAESGGLWRGSEPL